MSITSPERLRNLRALDECELIGPPGLARSGVDVATGRVLLEEIDVRLGGPHPLRFARTYSSAWSQRGGCLGPGFAHSFEVSAWSEADRVVVRMPDGREIEYDTFARPGHMMAAGDRLSAPVGEDALIARHDGRLVLETERGRRRYELGKIAAHPDARSLVAISRPEGLVITVERDSGGRAVRVIDPSGRALFLSYDDSGRLTALFLHGGTGSDGNRQRVRVARYGYSPEGDLVAVEDAMGKVVRYEYENHLLVRRQDRSGRSTYFGYDGAQPESRCVRTWSDGPAYDREIDYRPAAMRATVRDVQDRSTPYAFNAVHQLLERGLERFAYDDGLRLVKSVDARGGVTLYRRDEIGRSVEVVLPDGTRWKIGHDENGLPLSAIDPRGGTWRFTWDSAGRLAEQSDPSGRITHYRYEGGLLRRVERSNGSVVSIEYAADHAPISVRNSGQTGDRRIAWDWMGRPIRIEGAHGVRELLYDRAGFASEISEAGARRIDLVHDGEGRPMRALGSVTWRWTYDGAGNLASFSDGWDRYRLEYDVEQRLVRVAGTAFGTWAFTRDRAGRVTEEVDPAARKFVYRYADASPLPTTVFLPNGEQLDLVYDLCDRLLRIEHSDDTLEELRRDPLGAVVAGIRSVLTKQKSGLAHKRNIVRYERDELGVIVRESQDEQWVRAEGAPLATLETSMGTRIVYTWNVDGDFEELEVYAADRPRKPAFSYRSVDEEQGARGLVSLSSGLTISLRRDERGRVNERRVEKNGRTIEWVNYTQRPDGSTAELNSSVLGQRFCPVAAGRETERTVVLPSHDPTGYLRDALGALVERDGPSGRLRYRYHGNGLLAAIELGKRELILEYDVFGRCIAFHVGSKARFWLWHGPRLIQEIDARDLTTHTWVYAPGSDSPVARTTDGVCHVRASADDETAVTLMTADGEVTLAGWVDPAGVLRAEVEEERWPWRRDGVYIDEQTDLVFRRVGGVSMVDTRDAETGARRALLPDPRGLSAVLASTSQARSPFGASEPSAPWSFAWAWRISDEAIGGWLSRLSVYERLLYAPAEESFEGTLKPSMRREDLAWLTASLPFGEPLIDEESLGLSPAPWLRRL